jgi:hypothetical protein
MTPEEKAAEALVGLRLAMVAARAAQREMEEALDRLITISDRYLELEEQVYGE